MSWSACTPQKAKCDYPGTKMYLFPLSSFVWGLHKSRSLARPRPGSERGTRGTQQLSVTLIWHNIKRQPENKGDKTSCKDRWGQSQSVGFDGMLGLCRRLQASSSASKKKKKKKVPRSVGCTGWINAPIILGKLPLPGWPRSFLKQLFDI